MENEIRLHYEPKIKKTKILGIVALILCTTIFLVDNESVYSLLLFLVPVLFLFRYLKISGEMADWIYYHNGKDILHGGLFSRMINMDTRMDKNKILFLYPKMRKTSFAKQNLA